MMSTRLKNSPAHRVWVSEFAPAKAWQALAWPGLLPSAFRRRSQLTPSTKRAENVLTSPEKPHGPSVAHLITSFHPHIPGG